MQPELVVKDLVLLAVANGTPAIAKRPAGRSFFPIRWTVTKSSLMATLAWPIQDNLRDPSSTYVQLESSTLAGAICRLARAGRQQRRARLLRAQVKGMKLARPASRP